MKLLLPFVLLMVSLPRASAQAPKQEGNKDAIRRGELVARGRPPMNPPLWSVKSYENAWKLWGVKEKPADYQAAFRARYGLLPAPYDNDGLPMGLHYSKSFLGKGIINDCLLCHAGAVAGQTIIGLGNAALDLQGLFGDFSAGEGYSANEFPFHFSYVRGTIDPVNPVTFLMELRKPDLSMQAPAKLDYYHDLASDPPAWWLLKRKKTRNWTGAVDARSMRIDMVNLLSPLNSADYIKKQEPAFADIHAFVLSVESPKYPFSVDRELVVRGQGVFEQTCARCHGTYGPGGKYPDKIVPLETIGTDPRLAQALSTKNLHVFNKSWFAQEKGPDGKHFQIAEIGGYQAPPLDGIWATAPYFHNSSVPTVYHVLNSKARPKLFTRSYGSGKEDYDTVQLGVKFTALDKLPDAALSPAERRKIYDTSRPGLSNAGHTFGDSLTEDERRAVVEYLKTL
jgi:mono/diheme cytochrome c family protein